MADRTGRGSKASLTRAQVENRLLDEKHDELERLVRAGRLDPNIQVTGGSLLEVAAMHCHLSLVEALLDAGADIHHRHKAGNSVLHLLTVSSLCRAPVTPIITCLIEAGAEIEARNGRSETPLMKAVSEAGGNIEVALLLIDAGADVNARDDNGRSVWMISEGMLDERYPEGQEPIRAALLAAGATREGAELIQLARAAGDGDLARIRSLLEKGAEPDGMEGRPLWIASSGGHTDSVQKLLTAGADPNATGESKQRAVSIAALHGHSEIVDLLLEAGCDAMHAWGHGNAVDYALGGGHPELAQRIQDFVDTRAGNTTGSAVVPSWLHKARGIDQSGNYAGVAVEAGWRDVADAVATRHRHYVVRPNVYDTDRPAGENGAVVFQLEGHTWTIVEPVGLQDDDPGGRRDIARWMSRRLRCRAVRFGVWDTAGILNYAVYDSGRRIERFALSDERPDSIRGFRSLEEGFWLQFESEITDIRSRQIEGEWDFVDRRMRDFDLLAMVGSFNESRRLSLEKVPAAAVTGMAWVGGTASRSTAAAMDSAAG